LKSDFQVQITEKSRFQTQSGTRKKSLAFLFEEINAIKRQLKHEKTAISKKRKERVECLIYTEINGVTKATSSDEGEKQEYFFTSSNFSNSSKIK
jgi:hypothetical protein